MARLVDDLLGLARLRAKLERPGGPKYIETERGLGYRFVRPKAAAAPAE